MEKFVNENLENMLSDLKELVSFNSENSDDAFPFGENNRKVLDKALELMEDKGFKTKNLDYYCGYGEIGEGDKVIGILGHLDIVPAGEGWDSDPFTMTRVGDYVYGRGVSDDKGAVVASMYAMKYLLDTGYKFKKRVRLITGCNEETGSRCIEHYVKECGHIDLGFTPDGDFPGIYAEKGMLHGLICGPKDKIVEIKGGDAPNIVCKKVKAILVDDCINENKLKEYFENHNIKYEFDGNNLTVYGVAAHASTPDLGVNAINHMMMALEYAGIDDEYVRFFNKFIGLDVHGEKLGFEAIKDDATNTSINIGVIYINEDNELCATLDMRFPVTRHGKDVLELMKKFKEDNCEFRAGHPVEPLFFDISSPFIQALDRAYRNVTGDYKSKMEAIGGGTYAKSINNCIAFGCEFIGENNHIHDANERLSIESFKKQVLIYIEAIKNLNEVE